jgi:hypothetical protein
MPPQDFPEFMDPDDFRPDVAVSMDSQGGEYFQKFEDNSDGRFVVSGSREQFLALSDFIRVTTKRPTEPDEDDAEWLRDFAAGLQQPLLVGRGEIAARLRRIADRLEG